MTLPKPTIAPDQYTADYYLTACEGADEFRASLGGRLPLRMQAALDMAKVTAQMNILDVGCGRGEVLLHCSRSGARAYGTDYAASAVRIAQEALAAGTAPDAMVMQSDARVLPFAANCMDRVFMLDVVEHLSQDELRVALIEARRVLKPGGLLVVHTMPNTWYYAYGYPIFRALQRVRGVRLPANPRDRWEHSQTHINEQNLLSLRHALRSAGFTARVWLQNVHTFEQERNTFARLIMRTLASAPLLKYIYCNDLFALATKTVQ